MFKGPGTRTSRTQAESIGTDASGFTGGIEMSDADARAGHPASPEQSTAPYKDQPPMVSPTPPVDGGPAPFTLGNK